MQLVVTVILLISLVVCRAGLQRYSGCSQTATISVSFHYLLVSVCVDVDVATVKDCLYSMFFTDHV